MCHLIAHNHAFYAEHRVCGDGSRRLEPEAASEFRNVLLKRVLMGYGLLKVPWVSRRSSFGDHIDKGATTEVFLREPFT